MVFGYAAIVNSLLKLLGIRLSVVYLYFCRNFSRFVLY